MKLWNWTRILEKFGSFFAIKHSTTTWPNSWIFEYLSQRNKKFCLHKRLYKDIHFRFFKNNTLKLEDAEFIQKWMTKEAVVYQILELLLFCCSIVSNSSVTPWTVAYQSPVSMGFPRQEYWSGLTFPSAGDLPNPGIGPVSPALASGFFTPESPGKPYHGILPSNKNEYLTYTCLN